MIALAVLAAAGQAIHEALMLTTFAAGALVVLAVLLAVAASRSPRDREPGRLDEALHGPPSFQEQALMDAIQRGDLQDPGETGSDSG